MNFVNFLACCISWFLRGAGFAAPFRAGLRAGAEGGLGGQFGRLLAPDSPTTAWFARFYGRAVRDYVLTVVAAGGVYLSGGVAAKNPLLVRHPEFAREFWASPTYGDFLRTVAVRLVRDEDVGLYGAAAMARGLLQT